MHKQHGLFHAKTKGRGQRQSPYHRRVLVLFTLLNHLPHQFDGPWVSGLGLGLRPLATPGVAGFMDLSSESMVTSSSMFGRFCLFIFLLIWLVSELLSFIFFGGLPSLLEVLIFLCLRPVVGSSSISESSDSEQELEPDSELPELELLSPTSSAGSG